MGDGTLKDKKKYIESANKAEIKYGLPKNILVGVMGAESNFNPNAKSKFAIGLMQFTPATAKDYGIDPLNPEQSIDAAGKYLQKSLKKFGNIDDALKSYNMGVGGLQQVKQGTKKLPKETADYVGRVYKNAGIKNVTTVDNPTTYIDNPQTELPITNTINYFEKPTEISNFVEPPKKEEKETVDADVKKVEEQTKEYNFLDALKEMQQQDYSHLLPQEQEMAQPIPQTNYMQQYEQISQFVDNPIAQQGGEYSENELAFLSEIAIKDNQGQRNHPNKITKIEGNIMATDGYGNIPLYVIPNKGKPRVVNANTGQHKFKGATEFIEIPLFKK